MNLKQKNLIVLMLDAYKLFHRQMYPNNTVTVYSNMTPRSGRHRGDRNQGYVIVAGTQRLTRKLKDRFQEFFDMDWHQELEPFLKEQLDSYTGMDYSIQHIKELHELEYLPLTIKSLPEGSKCPYGVPFMTIYNTNHKFFWLTNYLETWLSAEEWNLITAATTSNQYYQIFERWAIETVGNADFVPIQGHDFSMRGHNGEGAVEIAGLGHLFSGFVGSDSVPVYLAAQYYYDSGINDWNKPFPSGIVATSVPATEHSIQCAYYNPEHGNELKYLDSILEKFPHGIVSIVCDGFDFWKFITEIVPLRKERILARNGKVVFRPDSGNIADIICGIEKSEIEIYYEQDGMFRTKDNKDRFFEEGLGAIECLWDIFGGTETEKGYKLLNEKVGLIYGDSVTLNIADKVCKRLADKKFASINWVAGIGSYTYQMVTRDTDGQALKATYVELKSKKMDDHSKLGGKNIFKSPKTGDGTKKSAKGLLSVQSENDEFKVVNECTWEEERTGHLNIIFEDGELKNQTTLQEIRTIVRTT